MNAERWRQVDTIHQLGSLKSSMLPASPPKPISNHDKKNT